MSKLYFARLSEDAVIPTKRQEDAGYDIYACFNENYIILKPNQTVNIGTGIASSFPSDYVAVMKERGSSGKIGIGQRSGVVDSGYRGEWFVPLTNHSDKDIFISKLTHEEMIEKGLMKEGQDHYWGYRKAITQAIIIPLAPIDSEEIPYESLLEFKSLRGSGHSGSSGK